MNEYPVAVRRARSDPKQRTRGPTVERGDPYNNHESAYSDTHTGYSRCARHECTSRHGSRSRDCRLHQSGLSIVHRSKYRLTFDCHCRIDVNVSRELRMNDTHALHDALGLAHLRSDCTEASGRVRFRRTCLLQRIQTTLSVPTCLP
jgi:hypothetical protein